MVDCIKLLSWPLQSLINLLLSSVQCLNNQIMSDWMGFSVRIWMCMCVCVMYDQIDWSKAYKSYESGFDIKLLYRTNNFNHNFIYPKVPRFNRILTHLYSNFSLNFWPSLKIHYIIFFVVFHWCILEWLKHYSLKTIRIREYSCSFTVWFTTFSLQIHE